MKICVPRETESGETRIPLIPANAGDLIKAGAQVEIESGLGKPCGYTDEDFTKVGATAVSDRQSLFSSADLILRLHKPSSEEVSWLQSGAFHVSFLDPFNNFDLIRQLAEKKVTTFSMEMMPRITRAQKMDALSSQANLGGYVAVILGAYHLHKIFPMMMTAAGTITPARVFVLGAGVAGLQAIATARRLGARVEAYDTRPVVAEQVRSLGAKFMEIDLGETGETSGGYAKALTEEQIQRQREGLKKICANADVVVTTAQVFGKKAPLLITKDILDNMKSGSVVVDMAVESGGNVEASQHNEVVDYNDVKVVGLTNLPGRAQVDASQVYSKNIANFVQEFWDKEKARFVLDEEDEIIQGCMVTHNGAITNENLKRQMEA